MAAKPLRQIEFQTNNHSLTPNTIVAKDNMVKDKNTEASRTLAPQHRMTIIVSNKQRILNQVSSVVSTKNVFLVELLFKRFAKTKLFSIELGLIGEALSIKALAEDVSKLAAVRRVKVS